MAKNNILQTIRDKEMDRKDFLKYSGLVLLAVVGLKGIAALVASSNKPLISQANVTKSTRGFGGGKYGA